MLGKTVGELLRDMSWREFMHWQAYLNIEPPQRPANERTAAVLAQIANFAGRSLRDGVRVTPDEYLGERVVQTAEQQIAFFKSLE